MRHKIDKELKKQEKRYYRREYNFLDSGKMFLNVLLYPLIVSFIFSFIIITGTYLSGHTIEDVTSSWLYVFFTLVLTQATFFITFVMYNKKYKINVWKAAKINKQVSPWGVIIVVVMSVACLFLLAPFVNLLNHLYSLMGYSPNGDLPYTLNNFWQFLYVSITTALIPAIVEELLMRGVVFQGCLKKWKPISAIVMGAVMFMLMHGALQQTVYQFILGIILCYLMYVGGNIVYPMIFHFVNNFTVVLVSYISNVKGSSEEMVFNKPLDYIMPIVYLIIAAGIVVGLCFLFRYIMKKKKQVVETEEVRPEMIEMIDQGVDETTIAQLQKSQQNLESKQKVYFWVSIAVGCLLWLINTISEII